MDLIGLGMFIPLMPSYADRLGTTALVLGLILGVYNLLQLVCAPLLGKWSDRVGRRPVLLITQLGSAAGYLIFACGDPGVAQSLGYGAEVALALLFLGRVIDGATGANIAIAQAAMSDLTSARDRAAGLGLLGAAFGIGFVLGPAFTAALSLMATWLPAVVAAGFAALAAALVWKYLPESHPALQANSHAAEPARSSPAQSPPRPADAPPSTPADEDFRDPAPPPAPLRTTIPLLQGLRMLGGNRQLRSTFAVQALNWLGFSAIHAVFLLMLKQRYGLEQSGIAWVLCMIGLVLAVTQGVLVRRLSGVWAEPRVITLGLALLGAGVLLQPLAAPLWLALVAAAMCAAGQGFSNPNIASLVSKQAPTQLRAAALGVSAGLASAAQAIGQPLMGLLYDLDRATLAHITISNGLLPFWAAGAFYAASFIILRALPGTPEPAPAPGTHNRPTRNTAPKPATA